MPFVEQGVHHVCRRAAQSREDRGDAGISHQKTDRAGGAQVVEEPVRKCVQSKRGSNDRLEENAVKHLAADGDTRGPGDSRRAGARV